jgi:hypothetical protein
MRGIIRLPVTKDCREKEANEQGLHTRDNAFLSTYFMIIIISNPFLKYLFLKHAYGNIYCMEQL